MSILKKFFGGGAAPAKEPEIHNGYRIFADPQSASGGYRIFARIEKEIDGEVKVHDMLRADQCNSAEEAERISILKAKMLIDQQGDGIFR